MKWDGSQLTGIPTSFSLRELKAHRDNLYATDDYANIYLFDGVDWNKQANVFDGTEYTYVDLVYYNDQLFIMAANEVWGSKFFTLDGNQLDSGIPFSRNDLGNSIWTSEVLENTLYLGGEFNTEVLGTNSSGLVTWDGEQWGVFAKGPAETSISAIQEFQNKLFVAANLDGSIGQGIFNTRNTHYIAIWQPQ